MYAQLSSHIKALVELGIAKYGSAAELSRQSGVSKPNLSRWLHEKGGLPKLGELAPLMKVLGASFAMPDARLLRHHFPPLCRASLGPGGLVLTPTGEKPLALEELWLTEQGISIEHSALITVEGSAMEPVLPAGSLALVDMADTCISSGSIYLLIVAEELQFRRIIKTPQGLSLRAERPEFRLEEPVPPEAARILGRLRWAGHSF